MARGAPTGGAAYLTHDPNADTEERVAWTHTLNLANDHVPSAVDEMVWTARDAELLKQEAGVRAGGRATENTVKHVSLNWAPGEQPTKEHMIETAGGFLTSMGWHEQQTVIVSHNDKAYAHLHLMIGVVHPETGLKLDDAFERRRAQEWALGYEREQGRVHCEQRLKDPHERTDSPTRAAWMAFQENQKQFERAEKNMHAGSENSAPANERDAPRRGADWKILKDLQRDERLGFFADGKEKFAEIRGQVFEGVREDFRGRWGELYAAKRAGMDAEALAEMKAGLIAEQKSTLAQRRDEACQTLRDSRDMAYRDLLDSQNDTRLQFRERLAAGLDTEPFFQRLREGQRSSPEPASAFRTAAAEATERASEPTQSAPPVGHDQEHEQPASGGSNGIGVFGFGLLTLGESLFATFIGAEPAHRPSTRDDRDPFAVAAEESARRLYREREEADDERRQREKASARD